MPLETLALGAVFVATMSFTPGPANLSLLSVGASLGLGRAMPYLFGVWLGGFFVIVAGAFGLGALLVTLPEVFFALKLFGFAYICWLAWRLARVGFGGPAHDAAPSFWAGVALHPVNPKAYVQTLMVFTAFIVPEAAYVPQALALVVISMVLMMMATSLWGFGGDAIRLFVHDARVMRVIAVSASLFMVVSVGVALAV